MLVYEEAENASRFGTVCVYEEDGNGIIRAMNDTLLYRDEIYAIQGAIFDVYREMGTPGMRKFISNAWNAS